MNNLRNLIIITLFGILFTSCKKDHTEATLTPSNEKSYATDVGIKLQNPYSVSNMQQALSNLLGNQKEARDSVFTSHYYVKFMPHNDDELSLLKNDTSLHLYQYPLDYEIREGSTTFQDPLVPEGEPTFQYAAVEVDFVFPLIDYEILERLFIPEQVIGVDALVRVSVDELVTEALRITDNLDKNEGPTDASNWRPAGTMKVWDDNYNSYVPIQHLKVKARRWFTTHEGITNKDGYYSCNGTFKREANYSLQFERYDFEIRDSWLGTANINGPKKKGNWDLNMYNDEKEFWATIFRATSHYYYDDIHNLRRPPQNSFWNTQLKLRAIYEANSSNGSHCAACLFLGLGSAIKIYNPQNESRAIYGTTIHEIAHASHWNMDHGNYNNGELILLETWARGVQRDLTRIVYPTYSLDFSYSRRAYTGLVEDLLDGNKTRTSYYYYLNEDNPWVSLTKSYSDQVSGYSIRQLEDALKSERTWNDWKNKIKNLYNNATENNLDASFNYWAD